MIRKYKASDRDALLEVWRKASALAHPFLSEDFMAREAEYMRNVFRADGERWVLEENGQPIGFIALIDNEIAGLFLHPSFHGKGLGRAMVDHAVSLKGPTSSRSVQRECHRASILRKLWLRFRGTIPA